jgi:hypothetical protein
MSKHRKIVLTDDQRKHLENLIGSGSGKARMFARARILLLSDHGEHSARSPLKDADVVKDADVAAAVSCSVGRVRNIRHRFLDEGLQEALREKPRPGASVRPKITGDVEAHLIATACSAPPEGQARWTLKLLAERLVELGMVESVSRDTIHRHLNDPKRGR